MEERMESGSPNPPAFIEALQEMEEPQQPQAETAAPPVSDLDIEAADRETLAEELRRLRQRIGTEDDVAVVKSQRDKLRNRLAELEQQLAAKQVEEQMRQQIAQMEAAYQQWVGQWRNYIDSQADPAARQAAEAEFAQHDQNVRQQMEQRVREMNLQLRESALAAIQQASDEERRVQAVIEGYKEAAKAIGADPEKLDTSSFSKLIQSFTAEAKKVRGSGAYPTPPQRGGRASRVRDVQSWFDYHIGKGDFAKIEQAFEAAKTFPGLRVEDIISR
jgi:hypothetical protein